MKSLVLGANASPLNLISVSRISPRIVGGTEAAPGRYPWMTALFYRGCSPSKCQFCGGALVHPSWVLTAAHCAAGISPNRPIDAFLGSTDLADPGERHRVAELIIHEDFDPNTLDNDLALLRLDTPSAQPIVRIIEDNDPDGLTAPGQPATIIGWGATSEGGEGSRRLLEITVPIVTHEQARVAYAAENAEVTENMLAAGVLGGGKDACQGDSGGPLVVASPQGEWILAGATSWGIGCARPGLPGLYTRLSRYGDWLRERLH